MNLKLPLVIAVAALSLQACRDDEKGLSGNYTLKGDVNAALPILLERTGDCETMLEAGSLTFKEENDTISKYQIIQHCPAKADSTIQDPGARGGRYEMRGDTIGFFNEAEMPVGIAIRRADTLKITGPQHTLIYLKD